MKYVRPFNPDEIEPGETSGWLLAPDEDAGCTIRVRKGGKPKAALVAEPFERYALVLKGEATLHGVSEVSVARADDVIHISAHQPADISGTTDTAWIEINATTSVAAGVKKGVCRVVRVERSGFKVLEGLAYQSLLSRDSGSDSLRMNFALLEPRGGSPDFHIHVFNQIYLLLEGEETVDIGRTRHTPKGYAVVFLPGGVVHRQFNASDGQVKIVTLLVPEPQPDAILDFAVTIHNREGEVMTRAQAESAARDISRT